MENSALNGQRESTHCFLTSYLCRLLTWIIFEFHWSVKHMLSFYCTYGNVVYIIDTWNIAIPPTKIEHMFPGCYRLCFIYLFCSLFTIFWLTGLNFSIFLGLRVARPKLSITSWFSSPVVMVHSLFLVA